MTHPRYRCLHRATALVAAAGLIAPLAGCSTNRVWGTGAAAGAVAGTGTALAITLAVGRSILLESTLSFFGVGVQPPAASWGNMLYQAQTTMSTEPWLAFFPGLFILVTTLSVNALGDRIADAPGS